jgi:excisionase family DNA binding protein
MKKLPYGHKMMTRAEIAILFRVHPKTVTRWAKTGHLRTIRTPGGHRRYYEEDVRTLLDASATATTGEVADRGR